MMASPTTAPRPMTRLNTPAGRPQRLRMSASAQPQPGTRSAGLNTTQLPYASAGAIFQAGTAIGKFQGGVRPTTPIGSRRAPPPPPRPIAAEISDGLMSGLLCLPAVHWPAMRLARIGFLLGYHGNSGEG